MANFLQSTVVANIRLNNKFHYLRLKTDTPGFQFQAGQYVVIKVDSLAYRNYSIASLPRELPFWEMFVDITPGGPGTTYLKALKPGDIIETTRPVGNFILSKVPASTIIFGATGCGIASIKPMIEKLLRQNYTGQINLFWGLRFIKDLVWQNILDNWQQTYSNFTYQICLSQPENPWEGKTGHITTYVLKLAKQLPVKQTDFYLCGNQEMINDIAGQLKESGFPAGNIYFEHY